MPVLVAVKVLSTATIEVVPVESVTPLLPKASPPPIDSVPPPKVIEAVSEIRPAAVVRNVPPVRL